MPKQDPENVLTTTEKTKARPPSYLEDDTQGLDLLDPIEEKKLVRKLDRHIIPIAMLLYLLSFLDRVNIGNAKLYGLEEDLGLTGNQYQIATSVLFVSYVIFEVPSNLVLKRFKPSRYIASIVALWGLVATLTGLTKNFGELVACRLLLGLFEAGLFPGLAMYLTFFYTKRELALRIGYLFVSAALAGACGGLLAYGIGHMDGVAGQRGWRWIMIFEGIPTFLMGIVTWFVLADDPEHARYLSPREKAMVIARREKQAGHTTSAEELHWKDAKKGFTDWKVLAFGVAQFGVDTVLYGYSTFLPTIIQGFGKWKPTQIQGLTVPCYSVGAITYLLVAKLSDSQQRRGLYTVLFGAIAAVGYALLISDLGAGVHYFGCFLVALGMYVSIGLPCAWVPSNAPRYGKRTVASGLQLTLGNSSGVLSSFLYKSNEGPRYVRGHAITMALLLFALVIYTFMSWHFARLNARRRAGKEDWKMENKTEEEVNEMGDDSPKYMYTI